MIKRLFSSQLRINMASGVVTAIINTIVMAVGYPIYLHFLGYEKYGLWLVLSVVLTFAQLGNLGIGQAVMKLVAEEHGRGDIEGIQRYVTTALALLCLSGTIVLIIIMLFRGRIIGAFKLSDADAAVVASLVPYIGILSIYVFVVHVMNATLSGLGRMDLANCIQSLARLVSVCIVAILLYKGFGILSLLIGNTVSYIINHLVSLFYIRRIARLHLLQVTNFDNQRCKRLLRFGGGVFGGSVASILVVPLTKVLLSRYVGLSAVSVYDIAFRGTQQLRSLLSSGFSALMPEISRIAASSTIQSYHRIRRINRVSFILMLGGGLPVLIFLIYIADLLLLRWLGKTMPLGLPIVFKLFLAAAFMSLLAVSAYQTLLALGVVWKALMCHILYVVCYFTFLLVWILTDFSSPLNGIGWASVCGSTVGTLYTLWRYYSEMRKYCIGLENTRSNLSTDVISSVDMVW